MELFSKELTHTDIKKRLAVPNGVLPYLGLPQGAQSVDFRVKDSSGRVWRFRCSRRLAGFSRPSQSGWLEFVCTNDLRIGDLLSFHQEYDHDAGSEYRIEVWRLVRIFGNNVFKAVA